MNWTDFRNHVLESWSLDRRLIAVYVVVYFSWGVLMNEFGQWASIARFNHWWQIITCYILYMIPISLLLRKLSWHAQYAYGLIAMGVLEFLGYALETSYAYPNNLMDQFFNVRNFSLAMAMFFAAYFPLGNAVVSKITRAIFKKFPAQE